MPKIEVKQQNTTSFYTDPIPVHTHGFIQLVDTMGSDMRVLQAARVSTGAEVSKGEEKDRRLIHYLLRNRHTSPFEMCEFLWHVRAPMFVARQWVRHRVCEWNEESGRYKELRTDFFLPEEFRTQGSAHNKQISGEGFDEAVNKEIIGKYSDLFDEDNADNPVGI